jgi:6-phosphogluconolactonase
VPSEPRILDQGSLQNRSRKFIAYVACADQKEIRVFEIVEDPISVALVQKMQVPGPQGPSETSMPMAIDRRGRVLHAAVRRPPYSVSSFRIDPATGELGHRSRGELGNNPVFLSCEQSGRFLLSASYASATLSVTELDEEGCVLRAPIQIVAAEPKAHSILFSLDGASFYTGCVGGRVLKYSFDSGSRSPIALPPFPLPTRAEAGPRHLALHPNGSVLYVLNELDATISVYEVVSPLMGEVQVANALPASWKGERAAADIQITSNGKFLYASERGSNTLSSFRIEPRTGRLQKMEIWETEASPRSFALGLEDRLLVVAGQLSNRISVLQLDPKTGAGRLVQRLAVGPNPSWVEIVQLPLQS